MIIHRTKPGPPPSSSPRPLVSPVDAVAAGLYALTAFFLVIASIKTVTPIWNSANQPGAGLAGIGAMMVAILAAAPIPVAIVSAAILCPLMWKGIRAAFWSAGLLLLFPVFVVQSEIPTMLQEHAWLKAAGLAYIAFAGALILRGTLLAKNLLGKKDPLAAALMPALPNLVGPYDLGFVIAFGAVCFTHAVSKTPDTTGWILICAAILTLCPLMFKGYRMAFQAAGALLVINAFMQTGGGLQLIGIFLTPAAYLGELRYLFPLLAIPFGITLLVRGFSTRLDVPVTQS